MNIGQNTSQILPWGTEKIHTFKNACKHTCDDKKASAVKLFVKNFLWHSILQVNQINFYKTLTCVAKFEIWNIW